jgi:hypothetical protein
MDGNNASNSFSTLRSLQNISLTSILLVIYITYSGTLYNAINTMNSIFLESLTVAQPVKKYIAFMENKVS